MREVFSSRRYAARSKAESTRQVKRGDVLLTSHPFVYLVSSSHRLLYCNHCFAKKKDNGLQRCSACHQEYYCGKRCQAAAWSIHRLECQRLKKVAPKVLPDAARIMARVILKLKNGGDKEEEQISPNYTRKFKDLMNHYSDIKEDIKRQEHLASLVGIMYTFLEGIDIPNEAEMQGIFGRICVNSFSITDPDQNTVGTGIYLAASIFDHSCEPNAYVTFEGNKLTCRALIDFPVFKWSKVRISYIDVLNPRKERLADLYRRYYFWCECVRCNSLDWEGEESVGHLICDNKKCSEPSFIFEHSEDNHPWWRNEEKNITKEQELNIKEEIEEGKNVSEKIHTSEKFNSESNIKEENLDERIITDGVKNAGSVMCAGCGMSVPMTSDRLVLYRSIATFCREQLDLCKNHYYLDLCEKALEKATGVLHDINLLTVKLRDAAFEAAISLNHWEKASLYGLLNIKGLSHYYGENHPSLGIVLLKLGKILVYRGQCSEAVRHLTRAESILRISHGTSHPLYTQDLMPLLIQARQELLEEANRPEEGKKKKGALKKEHFLLVR